MKENRRTKLKGVSLMLSSEQQSNLQSKLTGEKKELEHHISLNNHFGIGEDENFYNYVGELSTYDNHPADTATELYERGKDLALNEHFENELNQVNRALQAIEKGTYGKCEVCGKDIPFERLQAIPSTTYCIEHSTEQTISHERPIEEQVLHPLYEKKHETEVNGFDEEDSWQAVAEWGSSDSPSDYYDPKEHYDQVYLNSDEHIGYVEDIENFAGNDIEGKNVQIYPTAELEQLKDLLDEEGIMTSFGDLKPYEEDPYTEDTNDDD